MNDRETLDAIKKIVGAHVRAARTHRTDPDPELADIGRLIEERAAAREGKPSDRDVLLDTADALGGAGNALFNAAGASGAVRRIWRAEDALRAHFGLPDSDAATVAPDPEKKE